MRKAGLLAMGVLWATAFCLGGCSYRKLLGEQTVVDLNSYRGVLKYHPGADSASDTPKIYIANDHWDGHVLCFCGQPAVTGACAGRFNLDALMNQRVLVYGKRLQIKTEEERFDCLDVEMIEPDKLEE